MAYLIDVALSEYYGEYKWRIDDHDYDKLDWDASNSIPKPTKADLESKLAALNVAEPMKRLRYRRDKLLQECDWTDLPNAPLTDEKKQEWLDYRQSLRDATEGLTTVNEINSYEFPEKP